MEKRIDDFEVRRANLKNLSDEELHNRFWELASNIVQPMIELGRKNTSPSIERSVLLRMGFSSLEAKPIVEGTIDRGLMGKGCGHVVYKLSQIKNISIREAGLLLAENQGWDEVVEYFRQEDVTC